MSNKQGLELIIEAARQLGQSNSNIRFVLCGHGPHKEKLLKLAANLTNVQFLDLQAGKRFAELLQTADFQVPRMIASMIGSADPSDSSCSYSLEVFCVPCFPRDDRPSLRTSRDSVVAFVALMPAPPDIRNCVADEPLEGTPRPD